MKKYGKFVALIVVVIGTLVWLATAGMKETQTYYKTVAELGKMGDQAYGTRLRVGGDVESGSIQRVGNQVQFVLVRAMRPPMDEVRGYLVLRLVVRRDLVPGITHIVHSGSPLVLLIVFPAN